MRIFTLSFGVLLSLLGPAISNATVYNIDFENPVGVTTTATAYDVFAPVSEPFMAYLTPVFHLHAGDQVNFGSVTVGPLFGEETRPGLILYVFYPSIVASYDALTPPNPFAVTNSNPNTYYSCFNGFDGECPIIAPVPPPQVDNVTSDLIFTLQSDTIQLGFSDLLSYSPPSTPELPTWAMMIWGFMSMGFVAYRRKKGAGRAI